MKENPSQHMVGRSDTLAYGVVIFYAQRLCDKFLGTGVHNQMLALLRGEIDEGDLVFVSGGVTIALVKFKSFCDKFFSRDFDGCVKMIEGTLALSDEVSRLRESSVVAGPTGLYSQAKILVSSGFVTAGFVPAPAAATVVGPTGGGGRLTAGNRGGLFGLFDSKG